MDDDGDDKEDTKRRSRNLSEKKRRDQFNMLVNELGSMVSTGNRKMDKSSILKSTIAFLRNHNELTLRSRAHDINEEWKPGFLSNEEFTYLVLEALDGFLMVISATGRICYVSESITSLLGHNLADVINKSIFDLAHGDDRSTLYNMLQNPGPGVDSNQIVASGNELRFQCHMKRGALDIKDEVTFELVQFSGHFRLNMEPRDNDELAGFGEQESRLLFVCTGKLHTPQLIRDVSLLDTNSKEFTSRHSLEWKFLFLDHRAPPIIGYLPFEVLGTSGYDYYHFDDLEKVVNCHEALMEKGEMTSCYYRFLTKGQQWIWLQTRFYITYHQWNSKPEFVVCTHRVVSYADVAKSMKQEHVEDLPGEAEPRETEMDNNAVMKEAPNDDTSLVNLSPIYAPDTTETFRTYPVISQAPPMRPVSPGNTATTVTSAETSTGSASGAGTVVTANTSWQRPYTPYTTGSDTASLSGDSRSSQRNGSHGGDSGIYPPYTPQTPYGLQGFENVMINGTGQRYYGHGCEVGMVVYPNKGPGTEPALVPQHGVGAQYLDPAPYMGTVSGVLPIPLQPIHSVPVIVQPDQTQIQQKHEELQQMIVRQQEELRHVKEQLLLARLGLLQPLVNVPNTYTNTQEVQQNQNIQPQIAYDRNQPRSAPPGYQPPTQSQQPQPQPQPPNSSNHHPHMPQ